MHSVKWLASEFGNLSKKEEAHVKFSTVHLITKHLIKNTLS